MEIAVSQSGGAGVEGLVTSARCGVCGVLTDAGSFPEAA